MITMRTSIIRLLVSLAAFVVFYLYTLLNGDSYGDVMVWLVISWLVMFFVWTLFAWLRERIGRHCYWVIPVLCALYYGIGLMIVERIPGWSGLGAALLFLFSVAVLLATVIFFVIEMLIRRFYRKK